MSRGETYDGDLGPVNLESSLDEEVRPLHQVSKLVREARERRSETRERSAESAKVPRASVRAQKDKGLGGSAPDDGDSVQSLDVPLNESVDEVRRSDVDRLGPG